MGSRGCDGYGKEWESGDPVCLDCPDEYTCRDRTLKRRRLHEKQKREREPEVGRDYKGVMAAGKWANRSIYSYPTNTKYLLPEDGESAVSRISKNMLAGGLSAIGGEIFAFFQEWRWPFTKASSAKPAETPRPQPTQAEKPKPRPIPKPSKRIAVEDFDDELDIDLDDL